MKYFFIFQVFTFFLEIAAFEEEFALSQKAQDDLFKDHPLSISNLIKHLIKNNADLNITDQCGRTLAHRAASSGELEALEILKKNNASYLINKTDNIGQSPLHAAAGNNKAYIIKMLADLGLDVNLEDVCRKTPLHIAAEKGHLDSLKILIEKGAEVNKKTRYFDRTAMHLAARNGQQHIIRELSQYNNTISTRDADERTPLWHAVTVNQSSSVKELVGLGAEITPMIIWEAVDKGHIQILKFLISKGADVNAKANSDSTLLVRAAYRNFPEVAKVLIDKGADVRGICCYIRWTPLHEAASYDWPVMAKLFLDRGANINAKDRRGQTPLDVAGPSVRKILLERGAKRGSQL